MKRSLILNELLKMHATLPAAYKDGSVQTDFPRIIRPESDPEQDCTRYAHLSRQYMLALKTPAIAYAI